MHQEKTIVPGACPAYASRRVTDFAQGPHSRDMWHAAADIVAAIEALPFLHELAQGTLDAHAFTYYILQDELYLRDYSRAMALLAANADLPEEARFWLLSSAHAVQVEEQVHADLLADPRLAPVHAQLLNAHGEPRPSPTTLGYVSWLKATAAMASHGEGVAAVLPCFWVYAHVGKCLAEEAAPHQAENPFQAWIAMYDSEEFAASTRQAVGWLEHHLAAAGESGRTRMRDIFIQACEYELHFWASAHAMQDWTPRFAAAS